MRRNKSLQPLSRQHHHGLLLCWKIRQGLSKDITPERIKKYTNWFYKNHILPHFELEERHVFPLLGNEHELVKEALSDHRRLKSLFEEKEEIKGALEAIEKELDEHIRFEERVLFQKMQETLSTEELKQIDEVHKEEPFVENEEDNFWK